MVETLSEGAALEWLRSTAEHLDPGSTVVEVGVYRGGSLRHLADGCLRSNSSIYGIDPWNLEGAYADRPHMRRRYVSTDQAVAAEHVPEATLIRGFSADVAREWSFGQIDLLFIDAVHREPDVLADFYAWRDHLVPGSWVIFDDYWPGRFDGVIDAVERIRRAGHVTPPTVVGKRTAVTRLT